MSKEDIFAFLIFLAVAILFIFLLTGDSRNKEQHPRPTEEIERLEKLEQVELKKIDSLQARVRELDSIILETKKEAEGIDTIIIKEREEIKKLPLNSSVNLLKTNLQEYESAKLHP